jgi:Rrf2 family protein
LPEFLFVHARIHFSKATIYFIRRFCCMTLPSRKGLLAVAAVVDVALQEGHPISAKALAARHGVPPRHLEMLLRSLVRDGILKGIRGPRGGYELARESHDVTLEDILRAAAADEPHEQPQSELVVKVVLPILSAVEHEYGQALSRISLDDMVSRASLNGGGTLGHEGGVTGGYPFPLWPSHFDPK